MSDGVASSSIPAPIRTPPDQVATSASNAPVAPTGNALTNIKVAIVAIALLAGLGLIIATAVMLAGGWTPDFISKMNGTQVALAGFIGVVGGFDLAVISVIMLKNLLKKKPPPALAEAAARASPSPASGSVEPPRIPVPPAAPVASSTHPIGASPSAARSTVTARGAMGASAPIASSHSTPHTPPPSAAAVVAASSPPDTAIPPVPPLAAPAAPVGAASVVGDPNFPFAEMRIVPGVPGALAPIPFGVLKKNRPLYDAFEDKTTKRYKELPPDRFVVPPDGKVNREAAFFPHKATMPKDPSNPNFYYNADRVLGGTALAMEWPQESMVNDFWRMMQFSEVRVITQLEMFKPGCLRYYPEVGQSVRYGDIEVQNCREEVCFRFTDEYYGKTEEIIVSHLKINGKDLIHYRVVGWGDQNTVSPTTLIALMERLHVHRIEKQEKIAIHCRAGIGRTGAVVGALDLYARRLEGDKDPELLDKRLLVLREERNSAVQTRDQYLLLQQVDEHYIMPLAAIPRPVVPTSPPRISPEV